MTDMSTGLFNNVNIEQLEELFYLPEEFGEHQLARPVLTGKMWCRHVKPILGAWRSHTARRFIIKDVGLAVSWAVMFGNHRSSV